ncbi:MAG: ATP-binding protein [Pseudomonadota bacterium]|nr:ATP-binding protein [Pseudomonadota bacterium]
MPLEIVNARREYNAWVANEMVEDYALRFAPRAFRKWSAFRVANTALGSISFLALEAIGGTLVIAYGFTNAFWAMTVVSLIIFLTGLPISYYAAQHNIDIDLLTRGAGFGYIGSTVTSLIYASFTFIFFALEAAIMALALVMYFDTPLWVAYLLSTLVIIPLVMFGVTWISRLQLVTQPLWLLLLFLPYLAVTYQHPGILSDLVSFRGSAENGDRFDPLLFGAASSVAFALIAQIGEQADFLRFLPDRTPRNRLGWWTALLAAGPGWIVLGYAKLLGGALLAFLALQHQILPDKAVEPTQMYLVVFQYVVPDPADALLLTMIFVLLSQVKINVTNAYAGSLAWSNFFSRLTHNHPGRIVWLVLNVLIALLLMTLGAFATLENVLGLYANVAVAWVGALVADLVINKPLGLSPKGVEFRRAYLQNINPVGVGAMATASAVSMLAYLGLFGELGRAAAAYLALGCAFVLVPVLGWLTQGRYYLARRTVPERPFLTPQVRCCVCLRDYAREDSAFCPAYQGPICSLCCTLDARCEDACKIEPVAGEVPEHWRHGHRARLVRHLGEYLFVFGVAAGLLAVLLLFVYLSADAGERALQEGFVRLYAALLAALAMFCGWVVLSNESRRAAQRESNQQTELLTREAAEHRLTDAKLQRAREAAEAANHAKSRFLGSMSHELRSPLNSLLGYAQLLERMPDLPAGAGRAAGVIRHSGEQLRVLIDDLLDIAQIEARRIRLARAPIELAVLFAGLESMFGPQATERGLAFGIQLEPGLPVRVQGDERRIRQILINLIGNAIKFTPAGAVRLRVRYASQVMHVEVHDTGIGIGRADIERIFEPFTRVAGAGTGAGLGLTISHTLAQLMGGELSASSEPNRGSVFHLRLFLPTAPPLPARTVASGICGYLGPRRRILVVDDLPAQRDCLTALLAPLGFLLECAHDGPGAIAAAQVWQPDVILLDMAMPGMDGRTAAERLRTIHGYSGGIVLVTADGAAARASAGTIDACLVKPVQLADLLAVLQRQLQLRWV